MNLVHKSELRAGIRQGAYQISILAYCELSRSAKL